MKIAVIQYDVFWENIDENLDVLTRLAGKVQEKADVVLLPELFTTGFTMNTAALAEPMEGKSMKWMATMARQHQFGIAGSLIIRDGGKYHNRLVWMHRTGQYQYYDKRHLFRMSDEEDFYTPGHQIILIKEGEFRIRPLICYDIRFPVWSRYTGDYDVLTYLANWPASRRDVWISLLKARAIENQSYVIGVNRVGKDGKGIEYAGDSLVFDPKGNILADLPENRPGTLLVKLSKYELDAFREKFPVWKDADSFRIKP